MGATKKAIILAGGAGSRLFPVTMAGSKQLLPVFDKPMIYYPISTLMLAGIRDILLIVAPDELDRFVLLLGDGSEWGVNFSYEVQPSPDGLAQAFLIGRQFIGSDSVALILGDNIFYGHGLPTLLKRASERASGATIFAYRVSDPERFGVAEFDQSGTVLSIEEKPSIPKSNYAVTGLYFYDSQVCDLAGELTPSERGELEITDLNNRYIEQSNMNVEVMGRGYSWLDTGTHQSLLAASSFIATLQSRQGLQVCCPEEIAFNNGWIDREQLLRLAAPLRKTDYGRYLEEISC